MSDTELLKAGGYGWKEKDASGGGESNQCAGDDGQQREEVKANYTKNWQNWEGRDTFVN